MVPPTNTLYQQMGELQAEVRNLIRAGESRDEKLDQILDELSALAQIKRDVATIMPVVDRWKRLEQRGIGIMIAIGLMGGGVGAGVVALFNRIFPHP